MNDNYCPSLSPQIANVLLESSQLIGRALDPLIAINGILKLLSDHLALKQGRVVLPDPESGLLHIAYAYGLTEIQKTEGFYGLGEGITGRVMSTGEIALIPDISKAPEYVSRITTPFDHQHHATAYIAVPIMQNDAPAGVLAVHRLDTLNCQFESDLYVLQIVAAMISQILSISQLVKEKTSLLEQECRNLKTTNTLANQTVYGILGKSPRLRQSIGEAHKAATSEATVMLIGESGTGKERFARMIHLASGRRDRPFVCINCAAIPPNLLESELFGHVKGGFTGAISSRPGKFEVAATGTLFLDEIGDMAFDLQAKLLRVLQEKTVQRIGSNEDTPVDVRVITATNKQLEDAVKNGVFRVDLYYRLNVIRIDLPPLRERDGDIQLLALYFLSRANQIHRHNVVLSKDALKCLENYDWPGNVRQLENVIERLVIMSDTNLVSADEINLVLRQESQINVRDLTSDTTKAAIVDDLRQPASRANVPTTRPYNRVRNEEREAILTALLKARGNKTLAARHLGMSSRQLHYRLNKLAIDY